MLGQPDIASADATSASLLPHLESFRDSHKKTDLFHFSDEETDLKPERENYVQFDGLRTSKAVELVFGTISQVKSNFI